MPPPRPARPCHRPEPRPATEPARPSAPRRERSVRPAPLPLPHRYHRLRRHVRRDRHGRHGDRDASGAEPPRPRPVRAAARPGGHPPARHRRRHSLRRHPAARRRRRRAVHSRARPAGSPTRPRGDCGLVRHGDGDGDGGCHRLRHEVRDPGHAPGRPGHDPAGHCLPDRPRTAPRAPPRSRPRPRPRHTLPRRRCRRSGSAPGRHAAERSAWDRRCRPPCARPRSSRRPALRPGRHSATRSRPARRASC